MFEKQILEKIINLRKEKKISQRKMAAKIGISVTYFSVIERGRARLSLRRFVQICEVLEIKPHRLLESQNENPEREELLMEIIKDLSPKEMELLVGIAQMMRDQYNLR